MKIEKRKAPYEHCPNVKFLTVEGLKTAQSWRVIEMLSIMEFVPLIIEIGTCRGGFSLLLREAFSDAEIHTFDIVEWKPKAKIGNLLHKHNINSYIEDCFNSERLNELVRRPEKKIVFCDGGLKAAEFNRFAPLLNKGDIIGVHDYFPTKEDYDPELWSVCETTEDMLITDGFEKVYEKESLPAVWGLFRKL